MDSVFAWLQRAGLAGASVILRLPLTIAILHAAILRAGGLVFAAPESYVDRVLAHQRSRLRTLPRADGAELADLAGEVLPLVRLERVLGTTCGEGEADSERETCRVVVVSSGSFRYALLVDAVEEIQEIVLKPLGPAAPKIDCFAGTSVLGDGRIALVLDLTAVARRGRVPPSRTERARGSEARSPEAGPEREPLLLLAGFDGTYTAVPLDSVSHIERIGSASVEKVGEKLFGAVGGRPIELWAGGSANELSEIRRREGLFVALIHAGGRELGILSPRVMEAVDSWTEAGSPCDRTGGMQAVLAGGRIARLVDPARLEAPPESSDPGDGEQAEKPPCGTVLVVEDSQFLRKRICGILRRAGHRTLEAGNGREALEELKSGVHSVDVVVTDLEMPELDGFALIEAVRRDPELRRLPVLVLSALAKEEYVACAYEAGADEYLLKLDPERLIASVAKHVGRREGRTGFEPLPAGSGDGNHARNGS